MRCFIRSITSADYSYETRRPSLEIAPTTLATCFHLWPWTLACLCNLYLFERNLILSVIFNMHVYIVLCLDCNIIINPAVMLQDAINHWLYCMTLTLNEKGKEEYLYSVFYILCISQSAQAWITQFYVQIHHACLSFVCVQQMAPPLTEVRDI